jgi:hypothetical protein
MGERPRQMKKSAVAPPNKTSWKKPPLYGKEK